MAQRKGTAVEVDGVRFNVEQKKAESWAAVMLARDIHAEQRLFESLEDGPDKADAGMEVLAKMFDYALMVTDLTREQIMEHCGEYASVPDVAKFVSDVLKAASPKN